MKLSPKQFQAYINMEYTWKSSYQLNTGLNTLRAIVKKGYAEQKETIGGGFFPRSCTYFRKTDKPI